MRAYIELEGETIPHLNNIMAMFTDNVKITQAPPVTPVNYYDTNLGINRFVELPDGLLISNKNPNVYGGVTFGCGASTVYWTDDDEQRTGCLGKYIYALRIAHELLHHFLKDSDNIDEWLLNHKYLRWLYNEVARKSGECITGMVIQFLFYRDLYKGIDEELFNHDYKILNRNYRGRIIK